MQITTAIREDLAEILALQKIAFRDEAELLDNFEIEPLTQTQEELEQEFKVWLFLKAVNAKGEIVGSVRGRTEEDTLHIAKLMVHPKYRGRGLGSSLLQTIQDALPHSRSQLFTSSSSVLNLRMYERLGFVRFREEPTSRGYGMVYLEKFSRIAD